MHTHYYYSMYTQYAKANAKCIIFAHTRTQCTDKMTSIENLGLMIFMTKLSLHDYTHKKEHLNHIGCCMYNTYIHTFLATVR